MELKNYKIVTEKPELTEAEIAAGMNFAIVMKKVPFFKALSVKALVIGTVGSLTIVIASIAYFTASQEKSEAKSSHPHSSKTGIMKVDTNPKESVSAITIESKTVQVKSVARDSSRNYAVEIKNPVNDESESGVVSSVDFERNIIADSKYALIIKDSIYGPVNVSRGFGDLMEYKGQSNPRALEQNSAWFRFFISKDTILTFHIVPNMKTDDYDFLLFKCTNDNCQRDIMYGKIQPIRQCLSWNSSQNANTGLSLKAKDTTFEMVDFYGKPQGKTYASALHVKKGDVFYLMVNAPAAEHQEPSGFMIYFYNYLPKSKENSYKLNTKSK